MNAILLAGGKSSRYGSNKALVEIEGEPIIVRIVSILQQVFEEIYVVGSKDTDYSFLEDVILVEDIIPDKGPLGGLYTGLSYSSARHNLLLGCDMPFFTTDYFHFLTNWQKRYDVLVPEYNGYIEPLGGVYNRSILPEVERSIEKDDLKIKSFFPEVRVEIIKEEIIREIGDPARLFYNINYKSDLRKSRKYLSNKLD